MNGRLIAVAGAAALVAVLMLVVLVEPSLAGTSQVGENVGREVKNWATALLLGVAALVAIPLLVKRDVNGGLVLVLLVVLVGGFVFASSSVKGVIDGLWRAISG